MLKQGNMDPSQGEHNDETTFWRRVVIAALLAGGAFSVAASRLHRRRRSLWRGGRCFHPVHGQPI